MLLTACVKFNIYLKFSIRIALKRGKRGTAFFVRQWIIIYCEPRVAPALRTAKRRWVKLDGLGRGAIDTQKTRLFVAKNHAQSEIIIMKAMCGNVWSAFICWANAEVNGEVLGRECAGTDVAPCLVIRGRQNAAKGEAKMNTESGSRDGNKITACNRYLAYASKVNKNLMR